MQVFKQNDLMPDEVFASGHAAEWESLPAEEVVDTAQVRAMGERLDEATLGRMLFELAAAARAKGLDPEGALRLHTTKVMSDVEARVQKGC